jgi:hypothetical protein
MPATDFYTCRLTSLPHADSRPKHHNLYSPTGDPPKPGTGTTLLSRGCLSAGPFTFRSPGPVLDATLPSFHVFRLPVLLCLCAKLVCLGKRSRLCRRATDEEYPGRRRTKGARRRRQPAPAPSFLLPPIHPLCMPTYLQAADFFAFFRINLDCHATNLAPAGISPRSRYFHRAMNSLRARATMPIFRAGPFPVAKRRPYH